MDDPGAKYARLAKVFLAISDVFKVLRKKRPLRSRLGHFWPHSRVFRQRRAHATGRDVFMSEMQKAGVGGSAIERSAAAARAWDALGADTKQRYESLSRSRIH